MTNIDDMVRGLFDKLNVRKAKVAELKASIAHGWRTNGAFRLIGATSTTNVFTSPADVIAHEIAVHIEILTASEKTAAEKLGTEPAQKIQGYTIEDWYHDLKKRLATINLRDEEAELAKLEARLNQVLSAEERRRIEVELLLKEV